jgi:hypothetical protein
VLQDLLIDGDLNLISSDDVRCRSVTAIPPPASPTNAITVESSRFELVDSMGRGSSGVAEGESGASGIVSFSGGRLHVVDSALFGGNGVGSQTFGLHSGNGGTAILLASSSHLRITGGAVTGGGGSICWAPQCSSDCSYDGFGGSGIASFGGSTCARSPSVAVTAQGGFQTIHCIFLPGIPFEGTGHSLLTSDDPILRTSGVPLPGQMITFTVTGPPGAQATLWLGRGLIVNSTPPVAIEELVPRARDFQLGPIPASGVVSRSFIIPPMPMGAGFAAQAEVVLAGGETRRTNSCPVIVR